MWCRGNYLILLVYTVALVSQCFIHCGTHLYSQCLVFGLAAVVSVCFSLTPCIYMNPSVCDFTDACCLFVWHFSSCSRLPSIPVSVYIYPFVFKPFNVSLYCLCILPSVFPSGDLFILLSLCFSWQLASLASWKNSASAGTILRRNMKSCIQEMKRNSKKHGKQNQDQFPGSRRNQLKPWGKRKCVVTSRELEFCSMTGWNGVHE